MVKFINKEDDDSTDGGYGQMIENSKDKIREIFGNAVLPNRDDSDE